MEFLKFRDSPPKPLNLSQTLKSSCSLLTYILLSCNSPPYKTLNWEAWQVAKGEMERGRWSKEISWEAQLQFGSNPGVSLISPPVPSISPSKQQQLGQQGFDQATRRPARDEFGLGFFKPGDVERCLRSNPKLKTVKIKGQRVRG